MLVIRQVVKEIVYFFDQINKDLQHLKGTQEVVRSAANDNQKSIE